ncbi:alternative ribosome rescue aminoacyl-tRNA hydrolase ArfB [Tamlana sp. 2201CG12-4]|uniref:alternative ribosome rescue aminoacyl-tRNA hydrolase ArfB n=1 Tax=Tamlana sp. 2201CG12-4 TaxID=3112582 RepID=UPI002DBF1D9F|nr:alternative ribosome rescue aminoacyl-tRNA hydrolase ArfB [Tamlana sp. 2201CG12-4]MEC3906576.1 alternative ribosome rescue aminoacyl-tRNA hydrolase ArfB [Tamlana sp. 2201CG12-4]
MINEKALLQELNFKAVRSSGSGGQHVNKVSSKVELTFNVTTSLVLNKEQKERLHNKFQHRLTKEGVLILSCEDSRSQHRNKALLIKRFLQLIKDALIIPKKRRPTKIPKSVIQKRLKSKRYLSDKKANRKKPDLE